MLMFKKIQLIKLEDFPQMDPGAPTPTILTDESKVRLLYYLNVPDPNWDGTYVVTRKITGPGIVIVTFDFYRQYKFGSPNDEALNGHKYYKYGLTHYSFYELKNSDYIDELEQMNRVHPMHSKVLFSGLKHFIGTFHDSCFEIVAKKYDIEVHQDISMDDCLLKIANELKKV